MPSQGENLFVPWPMSFPLRRESSKVSSTHSQRLVSKLAQRNFRNSGVVQKRGTGMSDSRSTLSPLLQNSTPLLSLQVMETLCHSSNTCKSIWVFRSRLLPSASPPHQASVKLLTISLISPMIREPTLWDSRINVVAHHTAIIATARM